MLHPILRRSRRWAAAAVVLLAAACGTDTAVQPQANLVATAQAAGQFNTLLAALNAAGLRQELETGGPYTVFAPTDAAFAALPPGTVESLLQNPDALRAVLLYHVVSGQVTSAQAGALDAAPTLNGAALPIMRNGNQLQVGPATVVQADIQASNGIIHVIDMVLVP
jgi:uncharacterized surface protein with fasciclin (FAS1) repeats